MFRRSVLSSSILLATLGLAACGGGGGDSSPSTPSVSVGDTVALTVGGKLISFNRDSPSTLVGSIGVSGLASGETLVGIDVRPATNTLYGLGSLGNLYTLAPATGVATAVAKLTADGTDSTAPFTALSGTSFGIDFNPVADRLRVISNNGQDLRINVETGATTTDGAISPSTAVVAGSGYTNSFAGATSTRLINLNLASASVDVQNPPNDGVQVSGPDIGFAPIAADFDVDASNNIGYAAMTIGGASALYRVNLQTGAAAPAATVIGGIGGSELVRSIALLQPAAPIVVALTSSNGLAGFSPRTPNTLSPVVAISGLAAGETMLGIDVRPQDGLLWGLSSFGRLYILDATTGVATFKVAISTALDGSPRASVDFNPAANRLRVITSAGQSLRIAVVDIPASGSTAAVAAGTAIVDGAVNRAGGATSAVIAAAYNNNFAPVTGSTAATTLFDLDASADVLAQQNPPNAGTLVTVGALGLDVDTHAGFDIAGGENGLVLGAVRAGNAGPFLLRSINLATGAVAPYNYTSTGTATTDALSQIGGSGGPELRDIAILPTK